MNLLHAAILSLMLIPRSENVPPEMEAIPAEVRERATVAIIGTYETGRSPCQFLPDGSSRWYLLAGFRIEKVLTGHFLADYVGINQAMLPESPLVEKEKDLLRGEKYLVLLRPTAESMEELRKSDPIFAMDNSLSGEEIVAVVPLTPVIERVAIMDWGLFAKESLVAPDENDDSAEMSADAADDDADDDSDADSNAETNEKTDAPGTSLGYVRVVPAEATPHVSVQTDSFAAAIGTRFGMLFRVEAAPPVDTPVEVPPTTKADTSIEKAVDTRIVPIHIRVTHPPTLNPITGAETSVDEWDAPANIGLVRYTGWLFEADWEIVPGTWTIEVVHRGKVMAKKDFTVTR